MEIFIKENSLSSEEDKNAVVQYFVGLGDLFQGDASEEEKAYFVRGYGGEKEKNEVGEQLHHL